MEVFQLLWVRYPLLYLSAPMMLSFASVFQTTVFLSYLIVNDYIISNNKKNIELKNKSEGWVKNHRRE